MAASTHTILKSVQEAYPPLITKKQTAEFYATTTRTIDRWLLEGVLPADAKVVIGGSVRFRTSVLVAHIDSSTTDNSEGC
ncbi:MerR family transcriptional regulator [Rhodopirellula sallentina]|uniref:Helix-turn-helix domain-containing protein n=1 Tax=Rhodopirellula sallentina SM41 TaxID=1263870 RepID=M5UDA7_9BACT|nr:hypothetical protein [Rhodopirellula sallentina]EMI55836.1 hypothetical protein RSSM_02729 [Rhodopirellula sallentina SM41]